MSAEQRAHKLSDRAIEGRFVGLASNGSAWVLYSTGLTPNRHFTVVQATFDEGDMMGDRWEQGPDPDVWPQKEGRADDERDAETGGDGGDGGSGDDGSGSPGRRARLVTAGGVRSGGADRDHAGGDSTGNSGQDSKDGDDDDSDSPDSGGGGDKGGGDGGAIVPTDAGDAGSEDGTPRSQMLHEIAPDRGFVESLPETEEVAVGSRPGGGGFALRPRLAALIAEAIEWDGADAWHDAEWSLTHGGGDDDVDMLEDGIAFVSCVDNKKFVADKRGMRKIKIPQNHA